MRRNVHRLVLGASCVLALVATATLSGSELVAGSPTPVGPRFACATGLTLVVVGDVVTCKRTVTTTISQSKEEDRDPVCPKPQYPVHLIGPDPCNLGGVAKPTCAVVDCPIGAECGPTSLKIDHFKSTDKCVRTVVAPVPTTLVDYFPPK